MTLHDALTRAREIFGANAVVCEQTFAGPDGIVVVRRVGHRGADPWGWRVCGQGQTWETALAAAAQYEGKAAR